VKAVSTLLAAALVAVLAVAPAASKAREPQGAVSTAAPAAQAVPLALDAAMAASILQEINATRRAHGLAPVRLSAGLSAAAAVHTREMLAGGYFGHQSADGSPFWERVKRFYRPAGFRSWSVGENLVWATPDMTAQDALDWWMQSPEHRANLLDRGWREIGLAAARSPDAAGVYGHLPVTVVTADFGVRSRG
jgi:uncharacterized protein YkwD